MIVFDAALGVAIKRQGSKWSVIGSSCRNGQQGAYLTPRNVPANSTKTIAKRILYVLRFTLDDYLELKHLTIAVQKAATENDSVDIGIYNSAEERLGHTGATATLLNAQGIHPVELSTKEALRLFPKTVYHAALIGGVAGTGATLGALSFGEGEATKLAGAEYGTAELAQSAEQAAVELPEKLPSLTEGATSSVPVIFGREN